MSRKALLVLMFGVMAFLFHSTANSEPLSFEQAANVTGKAGIEIGLDFNYSYEKAKDQGVTVSERTLWDMPVFVRAGISQLEGKLTIPYGIVKSNIAGMKENNYDGLRDIGMQLKVGLISLPVFGLAIGAGTTFPSGDTKKYLGEGQNFFPFVAADMDLIAVKLHGNLGYQFRGEFTGTSSTGLTAKIEPGDATQFSLGAEIKTPGIFSLLAEVQSESYGESKINGITSPNSSGTTYRFVPGIRLVAGPLKAKLGLEIPLESKVDRDRLFLNSAPTSDWRIISGIGLQFSL